jgi:hypothetical protein
LPKSILSVAVIAHVSFRWNKKSPPWLVPAGFLISLVQALIQAGRVRRHVRHVVMVRMTMMYANLHPVEKL